MVKSTITLIAGALALAFMPAHAVELPDAGSKNFNPSGDTPGYFTNESAPASARIADTTQNDWSAVDDAAPARSTVGNTRSAGNHAGGHGKHSGRHGAASKVHSTRVASAGHAKGGATASGRYSAAQKTNANRKLVLAANTRSAASGTKTTGSRHGKPSANHANAGATHASVN